MKLQAFRATRFRIQPYIRQTPMIDCEVPGLSLKLESLQHTHSFKVRGAFAAVTDLIAHGDPRTILAVSAGNHGQAIARAASVLGRKCVVVVPASAPKAKIDAIGRYPVDLRIEGRNYDEAEALALAMARSDAGYSFVSPYSDRQVMLGQGSLAFEILEQKPDVGTVLVPAGGGGLLAGVAAAIKQLRPKVRVIGVQAEVSAALFHSLAAGHMVTVPDVPSIADGIQGNIQLDTITFEPIQRFVDDIVLVSEDAIRSAMKSLLYNEKLVAEGSAAVGFAAVMEGKVRLDAPAVALVTGGNVDLEKLL